MDDRGRLRIGGSIASGTFAFDWPHRERDPITTSRRVELIDGDIGRNTPYPSGEASRRIESRPPAVGAPKRLDEGILSRLVVTDDSHNPAIHVAFELAEERFERLAITVREAAQQLAIRLLLHV